MVDYKGEVKALKEMASALNKKLKTLSALETKAPPPEEPKRLKRVTRSRLQIEAQVRSIIETQLPGAAVKVVAGQTVIEDSDGQRFKLLIHGPFERIRPSSSSGVRKR